MAMWKNDDEMFALMKEKLYTPVVGDILDQMGYKHQFLPASIRPWLHRCLPHPTSCPERKRTSA